MKTEVKASPAPTVSTGLIEPDPVRCGQQPAAREQFRPHFPVSEQQTIQLMVRHETRNLPGLANKGWVEPIEFMMVQLDPVSSFGQLQYCWRFHQGDLRFTSTKTVSGCQRPDPAQCISPTLHFAMPGCRDRGDEYSGGTINPGAWCDNGIESSRDAGSRSAAHLQQFVHLPGL